MNKLLLATLLALSPTAAFADYRYNNNSQPGWSSSQRCIKKVYREEYIPGSETSPGYVKTYYDEVKIPCRNTAYSRPVTPPPPVAELPPRRNCVRGSILGGILGGGIAAGLSKPDAMVWSVPVGVVTGAVAGCEVENGGR
jgi:hypothetical protein